MELDSYVDVTSIAEVRLCIELILRSSLHSRQRT